jgi:N-acetylmuramoyl-L-alanine amidase
MKRRDALLRGGSLVLCLSATDLVFGAAIVAVRVWPAADYTRVTIESDQPLAAHNFLAENPNRLVVDIDNLELSPALRDLVGKVRADDPFIAGVRVGQNQPRVAPQQFTLSPVAAYQHRLVFDLYPVRARDPLLALLRGKELSEQQAAKEVQDALGEFIGKIPSGASAPSLPGTDIATLPTPLPNTAPHLADAGTAIRGGPGIDTSAMEMQAPFAPRALTPEEKRKVDRLLVIAIDPGHGGEDPGAIGPTGLKEKDVVLAIAMQLRERLNAKPGVRVLMTRDSDFFVPLGERVKKAERVQADLFVSIHADAFFTPEARGASVFALSQGGASSAAARWMAQRENQSDSVGGVSVKVKDAQVMRAMLDMSTTAQIKDSLRVGDEVLSRIGKVGKLHRGRVEQASFAVLKAPAIPSILVETAFISNPQEEDKLRDPDYRHQLVEALFTGIDRYFAKNPPVARHRDL